MAKKPPKGYKSYFVAVHTYQNTGSTFVLEILAIGTSLCECVQQCRSQYSDIYQECVREGMIIEHDHQHGFRAYKEGFAATDWVQIQFINKLVEDDGID